MRRARRRLQDTATRDAVLATEGGEEGPYASRVLLLSSFMSFAPDDVILRTGGRALLPRRLLSFLARALASHTRRDGTCQRRGCCCARGRADAAAGSGARGGRHRGPAGV